MDAVTQWIFSESPESKQLCQVWRNFLLHEKFDVTLIKKFDFTRELPVITDFQNRKLQIDFVHDKINYDKKKGSLKTELISKAMGGGRYGFKVLDLSAGLGIDALFLSQLGYQVNAVERNPVIYLALHSAYQQMPNNSQKNIHFNYGKAQDFLLEENKNFDVIYFDPMFPEKKKSALSRQEMMFFRHLVGPDNDFSEVIELVFKMKIAKRLVIKRPLKAESAFRKPDVCFKGKLIRFDVYGVR